MKIGLEIGDTFFTFDEELEDFLKITFLFGLYYIYMYLSVYSTIYVSVYTHTFHFLRISIVFSFYHHLSFHHPFLFIFCLSCFLICIYFSLYARHPGVFQSYPIPSSAFIALYLSLPLSMTSAPRVHWSLKPQCTQRVKGNS